MSLYKFVNYRRILIDKFFVFETDNVTFDKTRSGVIFLCHYHFLQVILRSRTRKRVIRE